MSQLNITLQDVLVSTQPDASHLLIFVVPEVFQVDLIKTLGDTITITLIENKVSKLITLNILTADNNRINFETNKTIFDYEPLGWVKLKEVNYWTVGHNKDGRVFLHTPPRNLTY
ncbi:hypothetical protein [Mucilaginibacter flavus]|uniref:hypothetical protein n=1 Tax=Mucilaginibacter flavus TaxID=931504 RepID=UPI0025B3A612|nr:hypothetical protein [Mucilaginibacter flavus]MDN3582693.1 hypothetical protein [Mucilaginibacter flavus]